jgi:diaminopimelate epimerase
VGADGLLLLEKSRKADIKMRIFNPDGTEAEMCGNGARCIALYAKHQKPNTRHQISIETKAGIIDSELNGDNAKIKLTNPKHIKLDIPIKINNRALKVNFIDTGVPHTVIFVEGIDKIDVFNMGRQIRYHKRFMPKGANVDFVEVLTDRSIKVRTYERGVEDETLACGTGAVASALITSHKASAKRSAASSKGTKPQSQESEKLNVLTKSGEVLKVYFDKLDSKFRNVWLEGRTKIVYKGVYYV